ncbi:MAG: phosphoserine phosphatase SerB [Tagaea sp.]|nr:phosphoserine phosphatase SerB [Tagaea sp.]
MSQILVLTSNPEAGALTEEIYRNLRAALAGEFGEIAPPKRLDAGSAAEFHPRDGEVDRLLAFARARLDAAKFDVNAVPPAGRRKKLLVADMESTLIENEMLDDMAHLLGIGERVAAITRRAMNGELDFRAALAERVGLLAGQDAALLTRAADGIKAIPGGATLARTMKANGALTAIVSGGFTFFTGRVRQALGFERDFANTLLLDGERLAGAVAEPVLGREAKLATLEALARELGVSPRESVAVGDGANDLAMLGAAGMGVAFRAKPVVAAQAKLRIDHGDLTALLFLQGYTAQEFVA